VLWRRPGFVRFQMSSNRSSLPDAHGLSVAEREFAGGADGRCHRGRGASFGHGFKLLRSYRRRGSAFASYGTFQTPRSTLNWANLGWDAGLDSATLWGSQAAEAGSQGRDTFSTFAGRAGWAAVIDGRYRCSKTDSGPLPFPCSGHQDRSARRTKITKEGIGDLPSVSLTVG
jgi:hypothetical protein